MKKIDNISTSRRSFMNNSLKAAALIPLSGLPLQGLAMNQQKDALPKSTRTGPLKILLLGGTSFLGPHQIAYALKRGHSITTFTRGKTKPTVHKELFSKVEQLVGDRENNLEALKGRKWDAVIDNSGRKVAWTEATAQLLKDHVGLYVYTSSVSVYYPYYKANLIENEPLVLKVPEKVEDEDEKYTYDYGVMKANSEIKTRSIFGEDRSIIIRPTFMVGPADRSNRFMYWPTKLAKGGDVIIPGRQDDPVQFIDVRDIAEWMILLIENKTTGTFNGVGPASTMGISAFAYGSHAAFSSKVNFIKINDYDFLKTHKLPFQVPWIQESEKYYGTSRVNIDAAVKSGLTYRPLAKSMKDIHDWWYSDAVTEKRRAEFESDPKELHNRQKDIIKKWKESTK
jgi:2'-hydroxyisoflavone reductase